MTNKQTMLRIKIKKPHQYMGDADNTSGEKPFSKPANKASISENTSVDHGAIREDCLSYLGKRKSCLNQETDHQLKNHNVCTAVGDEENASNASDEHLKEDEVPPVAESDHTCPVCGKEFKSMKSLSGHMRCHPERSWRGIQPPPTAKNSPSLTTSESGRQEMDDQSDSDSAMESSPSSRSPLVKWLVKRGRYKDPVTNSLLEKMNDEEINAAVNLFKLSREDPVEWEHKRRKHVDRGSEASSMDSKLEKLQIQEQENAAGNGFKLESTETNSKTASMQSSEKMDSTRGPMQIPCRTEVKKKRKSEFPASHICRTCNKSFNSHQALGGHMTGHKKDLMSAAKVDAVSVACNAEDVRYERSIAAESKPLPEINAACSKTDVVHQCKTCNKTFPSGQALGGHQRSHWSGGVEASMNSVKLQDDENRVERQIHNFDLNEVTTAEAEDDLDLALGVEFKYPSSTI